MDLNITIPEHLMPGVVASMYEANSNAEYPVSDPTAFVQSWAITHVDGLCRQFKVGPYFEGPTPPTWNEDGTPYVPTQPEPEPPVDEP